MSTADQIQSLMAEVGPLLPAIMEIHKAEDESSWAIQWEDETVVVIDWVEEFRYLSFQTEIGVWPSEGQIEFAKIVLQFNGLWNETGGVCLGLFEDMVVMNYSLPIEGLEISAFCDVLTGFVTKKQVWCDVLANAPASSIGLENHGNANPSPNALDLMAMGLRA